MIRAVFFDVGETLVDETRQWTSWAEWLGVTPLAFCAALGAVIERGEHHRRVFDYFAPGIDLAAEDAKRRAAGRAMRSSRGTSIRTRCPRWPPCRRGG